MKLGIVRGNITSTVNHPFYDDRKLLIVDRRLPDCLIISKTNWKTVTLPLKT